MADDFYREVINLIKAEGCYLARSKGKHQIWFSPKSGEHFPVPNPLKSRHTANGVLKSAGLPKQF